MAKVIKKPKSPLSAAPSASAGKVPKKGDVVVADESGSRNAPTINIGIDRQDRAAIAEGLSRVLADTYTLYLTTHNFHWNVTGPHFNSLHAMFMTQYTELWDSTDIIAERIGLWATTHPVRMRSSARLQPCPMSPKTHQKRWRW